MKLEDYLESIKERQIQYPIKLRDTVNTFECFLLFVAYRTSHGNKSRASDLLGIQRTNFHNKFAKAIKDGIIIETEAGYVFSEDSRKMLNLPFLGDAPTVKTNK